jgi:hypothetical protein
MSIRRVLIAVVPIGLLAGSTPTGAEGTWVVVPGRPDVPVIVNPYGLDASWTVVEGDFGLDRPAQVNPHIIAGPRVLPAQVRVKHYFPGGSGPIGYGRLEIEPPPNRRQPPQAQSYQRSWHTESDPLPASTDPPYPMSINAYTGPWGGGQFGPRGPGGPKGPAGPKGPRGR